MTDTQSGTHASLHETVAADSATSLSGGQLGQGAAVGRYIVLAPLGAGAMGVVYAAYDPELDRKVALKIVERRGPDAGSQGRAELLHEAQAMARLSHPNVITVHDVGIVGDRVFVAMELIDGLTLGEWLKAAPRTWREVLEVFLPAGEGLLAAHEAGLVHRDFKPDNVLVGRDGRVHVTDFGIARATDAHEDDPSISGGRASVESPGRSSQRDTRQGGLVGTPAYMAPEQFAGGEADARSDQFSFCVGMWEGLYGTLPFTGKTVAQLAIAVTRGELCEPPAGARVPARLRRILVRGLSTEPQARWAGMRTLLDELARDPARPRRRVFTGAVVVAAIGVAGWGLSRGPRACEGAADRLATVWDDARRAAVHGALAQSGVSYAADTWSRVEPRLDSYAEAWVEMHTEACEATRVRGEQSTELLDLRVACLDHRLRELDAVLGVLEQADARVAERAVTAVASLPSIGRCADTEGLLLRRLPPPAAEIAGEVEAIRTELGEAHARQRAGQPQLALERMEPLVERARAAEYGPLVAEALARLGLAYEKLGRFSESEAALREAYFTAMRNRHDETAAEAAVTLVFVVGYRLARAEDGQEWAAHAEAAVDRWDPNGVEAARLHKSIGNLLYRQRDFAGAQERLEKAVALGEELSEVTTAETEFARLALGAVLADAKDIPAARQTLARALDNLGTELGPGHPDLGVVHNTLGNVEYAARELDAAQEHYTKALELWGASYGDDFPGMCTLLNNLGNVADDQGDDETARGYYERAVEVGGRTLGEDHPDVGLALQNLGMMFERIGDDAGATRRYERSLEIREKAYGPEHPAVARPLLGLARTALAVGAVDDARAYAERALAIQTPDPSREPAPVVGATLTTLGLIELAQGQRRVARETLERALVLAQRGDEPLTTGRARLALARALDATGGDRARIDALLGQARADFVTAGHRASRALEEIDAFVSPDGR